MGDIYILGCDFCILEGCRRSWVGSFCLDAGIILGWWSNGISSACNWGGLSGVVKKIKKEEEE